MTRAARPALRGLVPVLVLGGLGAPILAGLWQTLRAAFGVVPVLGMQEAGLHGFAALWQTPGLATALRLTLVTGFGATLLSLAVALMAVIALHHVLPGRLAARVLTPFLAMPHAALAIGLAFVLAPSGWIARALAPLAGWDRPPDVATVGDPLGLALILGLMVKEVPFLLLVMLAALTQLPVNRQIAEGRALGYGRAAVWVRVIVPQLWPMIRLPLMVVLAYGLSVVDMALILGPSAPPTLAVLALRLYTDPELARLLPASAAALVLLGVTLGGFALLWGGEQVARRLGGAWVARGQRSGAGWPEGAMRALAMPVLALVLLGALALAALALWSVAWRWPWPAVWPDSLSLRAWGGAQAGWTGALGNTVLLALVTSAIATLLAMAWLATEGPVGRRLTGLVYLPLLVPQIGFLYGLNILALRAGVPPGLGAVIWGQVIFVFPYVMIALAGPWRDMDPALEKAAAALGAGPLRRLLRVRLPVLLAPLLTTAAIGVAVSVAQYLPTLFLGAGRIGTLTTEAVTLSSASDRRVAAVHATLQAAVPFLAYALAFALPALVHRNRRALRGGGAA